mgnify:CR=1 FL=1
MNGIGPQNDWASGQGSSSKKFIINEIRKNFFRGPSYIKNFKKYCNSIKSKTVYSTKISNFKVPSSLISILVIDVQGHELYVLKSVNFEKQKFNLIYYEDEDPISKNSKKIRNLLKINKYKLVGIEGADYAWLYWPRKFKK